MTKTRVDADFTADIPRSLCGEPNIVDLPSDGSPEKCFPARDKGSAISLIQTDMQNRKLFCRGTHSP